MPRPERPLDPASGPIAQFALDLRALRQKAGAPKYLQMARRTGRSRTALAEAAGGDHVPSWDTVKAFVEACDGQPHDWRQRWERLRETTREAPTSAAATAESAAAIGPVVRSVDTTEDVSILLRLWQEQRDQARQCENHRATLAALVILGCAGAGVASLTSRPAPVAALFAAGVVVLAMFGALASHKYYERHQMHMAEAGHLRQQLDNLRPHLGIERGWADSRNRHAESYPLLYRLRLHHLWVVAHLVCAGIGIVLLLDAGLRGRP